MMKGGAVSPRKQMAMGMKDGGVIAKGVKPPKNMKPPKNASDLKKLQKFKYKDGGSVGFNTKVYSGSSGKPSFRSQYKVQDDKIVKMPADLSKVQTFHTKVK